MYNNMNNNTNNNCCCTCGLKKAICIIENLGNLIDPSSLLAVYFDSGLTITNATLQNSIYSNLIRVVGKNHADTDTTLDLCLEYLNAICINPTSGNYQAIINELNKDYCSIMTLDVPCNENCCCKYSFINYFQDIYTQIDPSNRSIGVGIIGIPESEPLYSSKLNIITSDYDVAWLLDQSNSKIYLVPLCKIYGIFH